MADLSHDDVVKAFGKRYDFQSARTVLNQALAAGGLQAKDAYSAADIGKIGDGLKALGESFFEVVVEALAGPTPAAAVPPPAKQDDNKADKKAEKKEEKKKDDKKAAKKKK